MSFNNEDVVLGSDGNQDVEFHVGDGSRIQFDDNQLHITSSKFESGSSRDRDVQISSEL